MRSARESFDAAMAGFHKAIDERDIDYADLIWVQKSMTRLYRLGV